MFSIGTVTCIRCGGSLDTGFRCMKCCCYHAITEDGGIYIPDNIINNNRIIWKDNDINWNPISFGGGRYV